LTHRLYYTDSYLTDFAATVTGRADDGRRVYLDRTAFYPTSGGQPFDTGNLNGIPVVDVVDEGERVAHRLAQPLPDDQVEGRVDWERRFDHMQQHTGQHLLSAVIEEQFGHPTVSVHFGAQSSTLDLGVSELSPGQVREAERRANAVVTENRHVSVSFEDAARATGLRKASDRTGTLRLVTIAGLDRSACGGTHVRGTGEIGAILIRKVERVRKQVRLEFLCGGRAIRRARADYDILGLVAAGGSVALDEIPGLVDGLREQLRSVQAARRTLAERVTAYRAQELVEAAAPSPDGIRRIREDVTDLSVEELRALAQAVTERPRILFAGILRQPVTLVLAASADAGLDAGALLKGVLTRLGGRGGGTARLAQGGLASPEALGPALRELGFE
jgi:alanyl-tRNA synthetase